MEQLDSTQKFKLKKFLKQLSGYRGRHTELVSVYIPAGYDMNKIMTHLAEEQGTATNIKSTATRKNVINALEKMIQHLKIVGKTPPNGLAVFAGNVSEREGKEDLQVWSVEPPAPLNVRIYRCDKEFVLEPLEKFLETREVYGILVMDRREATIGLLKGKSIEVLSSTSSNVPGKFKAGGQSAARFSRLREEASKDFYKKIAEMLKHEYLPLVMEGRLKGILVGGPGHTKNEFIDLGYITEDVKRKIIAIKDITYTDESGLHELLEKCEDVLSKEEVAAEKQIVQEFLTKLATDQKMVAYGSVQVKQALKMGAVETLLISEEFDEDETIELEEIAQQFKTKIDIISTDTREGVQLKDLGMIAALLRYPVEG